MKSLRNWKMSGLLVLVLVVGFLAGVGTTKLLLEHNSAVNNVEANVTEDAKDLIAYVWTLYEKSGTFPDVEALQNMSSRNVEASILSLYHSDEMSDLIYTPIASPSDFMKWVKFYGFKGAEGLASGTLFYSRSDNGQVCEISAYADSRFIILYRSSL